MNQAGLQSTAVSSQARPRILVVDDDPMNRALVRSYLQGAYTIVEASSGPEALERSTRESVDLVLLDVMMPGMSGFEVCRELKRRTEGQVMLPVLLVTALSDQVDRNTGLQAGADDYLAKPMDRHELRLRVGAFLRLRAQERLLREQCDHLQHLAALKEDLFSLMVHDIRNPLSGVLALLSVIHEGSTDPRSDAGSALAAADKIKEILDDILKIRLLEENAFTLEIVERSASEIVRDAVASIKPVASEHGVELALATNGSAPLQVDRKLLRRAVENLLSNAVKYSPRHGTVDVGIRRQEGGVEIDVADRGPGVPESLRTTLFEKFGSVEAAQHLSRRGYGLGLYLVKLVAIAHGGRTVVRDRDGGGSVFGLWIPTTAAAPFVAGARP